MLDQLRSDTLRIASELPKGDPTRRKLLAAIIEGNAGWKKQIKEHGDKFKSAARARGGVAVGESDVERAGLDRRGWWYSEEDSDGRKIRSRNVQQFIQDMMTKGLNWDAAEKLIERIQGGGKFKSAKDMTLRDVEREIDAITQQHDQLMQDIGSLG